MNRDDQTVQWLLDSEDPSIRYFTLTELLDRPVDSPKVKAASQLIPNGPKVKALLAGQESDGGFGVHPYSKWTGAHWRLVSLVELGIPTGYKPAIKATEPVLRWLTGGLEDRRMVAKKNGLWRAHASMQGNALGVCGYLGLAEDPRVEQLARSLVEWQWPDGGWNCDQREENHHSSFYESLSTLWGLIQYNRVAGNKETRLAVQKASEFFLKHRLFRSDKNSKVINPEWLKLHYPVYWHYDILQALRILSLNNKLDDPRVKEPLDILEEKRLPDGKWRPGSYYWNPQGLVRVMGKKQIISNTDVVDWGRNGPNEMITVNALRVLKSTGRIKEVNQLEGPENKQPP